MTDSKLAEMKEYFSSVRCPFSRPNLPLEDAIEFHAFAPLVALLCV
jgi:hypothetical protein